MQWKPFVHISAEMMIPTGLEQSGSGNVSFSASQ
jgi:hypothetical protein